MRICRPRWPNSTQVPKLQDPPKSHYESPRAKFKKWSAPQCLCMELCVPDPRIPLPCNGGTSRIPGPRHPSRYYRERVATISASNRYSAMGSFCFTDLPKEIQLQVLTHLNFPDLARSRMSNRHMRDLPSVDMRKEACERLEHDFKETGDEFADIPQYSWRKEQYEAARDSFCCKGYREEDFYALGGSAPCFTCFNVMKRAKDIVKNQHQEPFVLTFYLERQKKWEGPANNKRICGDCRLGQIDLRQQKGKKRWLVTGRQTCVACVKCDEFKVCHYVFQRQTNAIMCDECWELEEKKWNDYERELERWKDEIESYLYAMRDSRSCKYINKHSMRNLERIKDIEWSYVEAEEESEADEEE